MKKLSTQIRSYDVTLREYYNVLGIREKAGMLSPEFNDEMELFLRELKELVAEHQPVELPHAA